MATVAAAFPPNGIFNRLSSKRLPHQGKASLLQAERGFAVFNIAPRIGRHTGRPVIPVIEKRQLPPRRFPRLRPANGLDILKARTIRRYRAPAIRAA